MKRGDVITRHGRRYVVNHTADSVGIGSVSLVREGSLAHMICFDLDTLRSHEPPRNSGEGNAVDGPMPLAGGDDQPASA